MFTNGKSYTAAAGFVLAGIAGFLTGTMDLMEAINSVLTGLGIAGLRHGISKEGAK